MNFNINSFKNISASDIDKISIKINGITYTGKDLSQIDLSQITNASFNTDGDKQFVKTACSLPNKLANLAIYLLQSQYNNLMRKLILLTMSIIGVMLIGLNLIVFFSHK